ncbi:MAG TPA: hypothetical protein VGQ69_04635 [Gemmatimonadales bacterium]|nr:hypothetical protein [Gemmatimonadales bacterium]
MSRRRFARLALLLAAGPTPLAAQGRGPVIIEWGFHGTATVGDSLRLGAIAGPRLALRTVGGTRGAVSFGAGLQGDSATARAEGAVEYQLSPRRAGRVGVYFGGGLAGVVGAGRGGYLLLYVGLERSPGLPSGWAVEAGIGGGFRVRAAYHWRHFPKGWRPQR